MSTDSGPDDTDTMNHTRNVQIAIATLLITICWVSATFAVNLIPCPDCQRPVSVRALMCPNCGCPGEAIAAAARALASEESRRPDNLLRVETDKGIGWALPVVMNGKTYAVTPIESVAGADTVSLYPASTNQLVPYQAPELADDAALVRFPITDTNLEYWTCAPATNATDAGQFWLIPRSDTPWPSVTVATTGRPSNVLAFLNASSNVLAISSTFPRQSTNVWLAPTGRQWRPMQPVAFRRQTRLLVEALATNKEITAKVKDTLSGELWGTSYLKRVAAQIVNGGEGPAAGGQP